MTDRTAIALWLLIIAAGWLILTVLIRALILL